MKRKATYKVTVTRREMLYVGDVPDHTLMLTELEGEPVEYQIGVAGEFVSRRSVGFHDRIKGSGPMQGYAITTFQEGQVYSRFDGQRDAQTKLTTGTWKTYKGVGKLKNVKGQGNFVVKPADQPGTFLLEITGDYEL
ncbi:MAG: hypothetical protein BZ151_02760 [Desulfobacca sp. 4484_104]|nr:MAG: hypothetical protein BZ151_02760 [Desulfobacca sp. 4484_104]RLA88647.1 MAG: hypothetical protein DRG58_07435 [Deltaproteobacteria bacterium]